MSGHSSDDVRVIPREEDVEVGDLWSRRPGGPRSTRRGRAPRGSRGADERRSEDAGGRRARRTRRRELRRARRRRVATVIGLVLVLIAAIVASVVLRPDLGGRFTGTAEETGTAPASDLAIAVASVHPEERAARWTSP